MPVDAQDTDREGSGPTAARAAGESAAVAQGPAGSPRQRPPRKRRWLIGAVGLLVLAAVAGFGVPYVQRTLNTVSTDDAFVNGHVTFVAPRVGGQISRVLVDDNNRVRKGDVIAALDKEPFEIALSQKQAAVDAASADLAAATAAVYGLEAQARSARWKLQHAIEDVDNQVALLQSRVAALDKNKAALTLAQLNFDRAKQLVQKEVVSRAEFDRLQSELTTAQASVTQSLAEIYQVRASLGLPAQPPQGKNLGDVPPDLDQSFSSVLEAQSELIQSAAQLGVVHSYDQSPQQMLAEFEGQGDIDRTFARLAAAAPAVKQGETKLESANRELAQAQLNLRYCDIVADIDGVVTRRNVNPGDYVQIGQNLMAIRSLTDIWVDANFKETQLGDLRIGQPVDLYLDMYGARHVFKGRIAGFTMGTGSTLALLPAQNATGNFVKVVQRLPVRIALEDYDAEKSPLFIGTSVTPYVHLDQPASGPDAGKFLQAYLPRSEASGSSVGPAGAGQ
jgi:membrane fusion protein (multidrug efflux system)